MWKIVAILAFLAFIGTAQAAQVVCLDSAKQPHRVLPSCDPSLVLVCPDISGVWVGDPAYGDGRNFCFSVGIIGQIETGDAEVVRDVLAHSDPSEFRTLSSGGSVWEAMKIGRMLRRRFIPTYAAPGPELQRTLGTTSPFTITPPDCGASGKPVCCASACALLYFGGSQWNGADILGLHRPTLREMGDQDSGTALELLKQARTVIKSYLDEMEVDDRIFTIMMKTPPERIAVERVRPLNPRNSRDLSHFILTDLMYPTSIRDWLSAKCKHKVRRPPDEQPECMRDAHHDEQARLALGAEDTDNDNDVDKTLLTKSIDELERMYAACGQRYRCKEGGISRSDIRQALEKRILSDAKPLIDKMSEDELREYVRANRGRLEYRGAFYRAYKRLEELTGDRIIGDPRVDCENAINNNSVIAACSEIIGEGANIPHETRLAVLQSRASAYWRMDMHKQALADFKNALDIDPACIECLSQRALLYEDLGDIDSAIKDYSRLIELTPVEEEGMMLLRPSLGSLYESRGSLYDQIDDGKRSIADYRKALQLDPSSIELKKALTRLGAFP